MVNILEDLRSIAIDSNIFVYYFEENPEYGLKAKKVFDQLSRHKLKGVTSIISLLEILASPKLTKVAIREMEESFYNIPSLNIIALDREIALLSAEIRRNYLFRTADSIQLATALIAKAQAFITNDDQVKNFKELPVLLLSEV